MFEELVNLDWMLMIELVCVIEVVVIVVVDLVG